MAGVDRFPRPWAGSAAVNGTIRTRMASAVDHRKATPVGRPTRQRDALSCTVTTSLPVTCPVSPRAWAFAV